VLKSGVDIFRRLILSICSRSAAITGELVSQPEQMPRVLEIAMQTALSKRGVAVITLPGDVALRDAAEQAASEGYSAPSHMGRWPTHCLRLSVRRSVIPADK
jgi:thiamine pyrophosphate-dependent acetolactate synthase large subunit-like protein